jgi:hypothetical protein
MPQLLVALGALHAAKETTRTHRVFRRAKSAPLALLTQVCCLQRAFLQLALAKPHRFFRFAVNAATNCTSCAFGNSGRLTPCSFVTHDQCIWPLVMSQAMQTR